MVLIGFDPYPYIKQMPFNGYSTCSPGVQGFDTLPFICSSKELLWIFVSPTESRAMGVRAIGVCAIGVPLDGSLATPDR